MVILNCNNIWQNFFINKINASLVSIKHFFENNKKMLSTQPLNSVFIRESSGLLLHMMLIMSLLLFLLQKCMKFNVESPIWLSKQQILCTLNHSLKDVLNYGLFQPAYNGKAGKFLDEQRTLNEYPFPVIPPVPYLEVRVFSDSWSRFKSIVVIL